MDLKEAKRLGAELVPKLPWQEIADSPTIRFYTDWSKFEGYDAPPQVRELQVGPCEVALSGGRLSGVGRCRGVEVSSWGEAFRDLHISTKALALHAARLEEAVLVRISGQPEGPVVVRALAEGAKGHAATHVLIDVDPGSRADIAFVAESADAMHTAVVEARAGAGSSVTFAAMSIGGGPQYLHVKWQLADGAAMQARPLVLGGVMNAVREEYVAGPSASVDMTGLELGRGTARIDHLAALVCDGTGARGYAKLYAVALERAFVAQRAIGHITKRGIQGDSAVEGVAYIGGPEAVAASQPVILVDTGDVAGARHSAADASLDEEAEYYVRSRGLRKEDIPELIVAGLVDQYLASLPDALRPLAELRLSRSI